MTNQYLLCDEVVFIVLFQFVVLCNQHCRRGRIELQKQKDKYFHSFRFQGSLSKYTASMCVSSLPLLMCALTHVVEPDGDLVVASVQDRDDDGKENFWYETEE